MLYAFGDSIMRGVVTDSVQLQEGTVKYVISENGFANRKGFQIRNLARYGSTIVNGLKNLDRYLREIHYGDKVLLEFGGNDCNYDWKAIAANPTGSYEPLVSLPLFRRMYEQMIGKIREVGAEPMLLSLPPILSQQFLDFVSRGLDRSQILRWLGDDVNTVANWHETYNLEIFKIGAKNSVKVIDITTIFLEQHGLDGFYCIDGMHPNEKGHDLIAQIVLSAMEM